MLYGVYMACGQTVLNLCSAHGFQLQKDYFPE